MLSLLVFAADHRLRPDEERNHSLGGNRVIAVPGVSPGAAAEHVLRRMRLEGRRRRRRPRLRPAVWGQFHSWVRDESVEAVVVHGSRSLYILQSGNWRELPSPFLRDEQVRELIRRVTLQSRRDREPVHRLLPEGFELFSWDETAMGETVVFLRRVRPARLLVASDELWRHDPGAQRVLARVVASREPVIVGGPGQYAREEVLAALASMIPPEQRVVWLADPERLRVLRGVAAVVAVDGGRLHLDPGAAAEWLRRAMALAPDWIVLQDASSPLLVAAGGLCAGDGPPILAACSFPLVRGPVSRPGRIATARSTGLPDVFRWVVEVGGYRRPVVEGVWRAASCDGPVRTFQRLPVQRETCPRAAVTLQAGCNPAPRDGERRHRQAGEQPYPGPVGQYERGDQK